MADERLGYRFVLVHGAGHGAWCWYKVIDRLQRAGYSAAALDLSSAGINSMDANEVGTLATYSQPLVEFMQSIPDGEKVVLVGHSYGGVNITYIMERFPEKCAAAIYVAASMLPPGPKAAEIRNRLYEGNKAFIEHNQLFYGTGSEVPTSSRLKLESVGEYLYHLCPPEDVELAKLLLKPNPLLPPSEISIEYTPERYGQVPRFYIKATQDKICPPGLQDIFLEHNPPKQVFELASDHSPFFSMPDAFVDQLLQIVASL